MRHGLERTKGKTLLNGSWELVTRAINKATILIITSNLTY